MKNLKFTNLNCLLKEANKNFSNRFYLLYIYGFLELCCT